MERTYIVRGMTCEGCVKAVTNALQGLSSELKVEVSLEQNTVHVDGDTDEDAIRKTIEDAGFEFGGAA